VFFVGQVSHFIVVAFRGISFVCVFFFSQLLLKGIFLLGIIVKHKFLARVRIRIGPLLMWTLYYASEVKHFVNYWS
jgi:hypothetical protein